MLQNFSVLSQKPNNISLINTFALFFLTQLALSTLKFGEAEIAGLSQLYTNR